jgi:hypothetical protein
VKEKRVVGWREWLALPDMGIRLIKAKVDTGARTSSLHAEETEYFRRHGKDHVRFIVHPKQRSKRGAVEVRATVTDMRRVRSSNGAVEIRPVIETTLDVGGTLWPIEVTLTRRDVMGFRMLLGRQALKGYAVVDPGRSYVTRKIKKRSPTHAPH